MANKVLSVGIPCYNSAAYMDHAIESILEGSNYADDIELIIVDDGSTKDDTYAKAQAWQKRYPQLVQAIHQENGGHGIAVLTALNAAHGEYFKVCDSDDWYDGAALQALLKTLRSFVQCNTSVDLVITNYVYENQRDNSTQVIDYLHALTPHKVIGWDETKSFGYSQNLLMHALCYRTAIVKACNLPMPAHTFYVDSIYAYVPLPHTKTLYYLNVDLYRYYIGREDQSVNEEIMASRIDQQLRITSIMMHAYHLYTDVTSEKLRKYMLGYLNMMMVISSIFARLSTVKGALAACDELWADFKAYDKKMYDYCRYSLFGVLGNLPGKLGRKTTIGIYRLVTKFYKFN